MTVLHTPAFWYGLVTGVLLAMISGILLIAYIHHKINREDSPEDDRDCPVNNRCPAYVPAAKGQRCTEASECSQEASEDDRSPPYDPAA